MPQPLPEYKLNISDYLMGYLLWIFIIPFLLWSLIRACFGAKRANNKHSTIPPKQNEDFHLQDSKNQTNTEILLPIILKINRWQSFCWLIICGLLICCGISIIKIEPIIGYFCISFFGFGVLVFAIQLLPNNSYLHLTQEGFFIRNLYPTRSLITWDQILRFYVVKIYKNMVAWVYSSHYKPYKALRQFSKIFTGAESTLPNTYGMKPQELLDSNRITTIPFF